MEENEENKNIYFENFKRFLQTDMKIKETLVGLAPTTMESYNEESKLEYLDKIYKTMKNLKLEFTDIAKSFDFESGIQDAIQRYFKKNENNIVESFSNRESAQSLYKRYFSDMNIELVESTKRECKGHLLIRDIEGLIEDAGSINELLHIMHSYITNNEEILRAMPIVKQKQNSNEENITLYGIETEFSKEIFEKIPEDLSAGAIEILSTENKILMMVRDVGHALSIDIDTFNVDEIFVKYFVPKLCNRNMIEALPGINLNGITENGATGGFITGKDDMTQKLFDFIGKVPTDGDMYKEGGAMYRYTINQLAYNALEKEEFRDDELQQLVGEILTEEKNNFEKE